MPPLGHVYESAGAEHNASSSDVAVSRHGNYRRFPQKEACVSCPDNDSNNLGAHLLQPQVKSAGRPPNTPPCKKQLHQSIHKRRSRHNTHLGYGNSPQPGQSGR